ncbi:MAG: ABC transporter substrate-binding protein, partial [Oscillospiraceae bacterium]
MFKKVMALVLALALVFSLVACGNKPEAPAEDGKTEGAGEVLVGAIYPLTGDVAAIGQNIQKGIEFAVKQINEAGGVNGATLKIIYGDSQGDPKVGMSEAERLITQENVCALLGCYQSGVTEVVAPIAEQYQVPLLTAISTADVLTSHDYQYFFRLCPSNMMFLRDMIQYLADVSEKYPDKANVKTIAVCADNTLLGQETAKWAKYWAEKVGIEVVAEVLYTKGAADLTSEVLTLKKANPDALVVDNYISDGILLTKTMNEQGYKPNIMIGKATAYIDPS